jgi:hypothetical protein
MITFMTNEILLMTLTESGKMGLLGDPTKVMTAHS